MLLRLIDRKCVANNFVKVILWYSKYMFTVDFTWFIALGLALI